MNDTIDICRVDGSITLDGQNINDKKLDVVQLRARVGMVFQKPNPFPKSIYDNIAYGPRIHGIARNKDELDDIVHSSLRKAGLWDEVHDRRYAIVIVTHSMQQAARISQKTAFFHLGRLMEHGDTAAIFTNPTHEKTKDYITGRYG